MSVRKQIPEINGDIGESYGLFSYGDDEGLAPYIDVANIACGFHGGDPPTIARAVKLAQAHGLKVCAQPSLPDREGFGRRELHLTPAELHACLIYQIGALKGFLDAEGLKLYYLKPHGAMYLMAARDAHLADAMCDAAALFGIGVLGITGTQTEAAARSRGVPFFAEFFADLQYQDDGRLIVSKDKPVDLGWLSKRLRTAVLDGRIDTVSGGWLPLSFQTVCVHNDMPNARAIARTAREVIDSLKSECAQTLGVREERP